MCIILSLALFLESLPKETMVFPSKQGFVGNLETNIARELSKVHRRDFFFFTSPSVNGADQAYFHEADKAKLLRIPEKPLVCLIRFKARDGYFTSGKVRYLGSNPRSVEQATDWFNEQTSMSAEKIIDRSITNYPDFRKEMTKHLWLDIRKKGIKTLPMSVIVALQTIDGKYLIDRHCFDRLYHELEYERRSR